jgi:hypothetical protein
MARKWSTALVDPPTAMMTEMAFSMLWRVMMSRGRMLAWMASAKTLADWAALSAFSSSSAAMVEE